MEHLFEALRECKKLDEGYKVGDKIEIISMEGEPRYSGKKGEITHIDDAGQLHGTWGGLAVIPSVDEIKLVADEALVESEKENHEFEKTVNGTDIYHCKKCGKYVAKIDGKKVKADKLDELENKIKDKDVDESLDEELTPTMAELLVKKAKQEGMWHLAKAIDRYQDQLQDIDPKLPVDKVYEEIKKLLPGPVEMDNRDNYSRRQNSSYSNKKGMAVNEDIEDLEEEYPWDVPMSADDFWNLPPAEQNKIVKDIYNQKLAEAGIDEKDLDLVNTMTDYKSGNNYAYNIKEKKLVQLPKVTLPPKEGGGDGGKEGPGTPIKMPRPVPGEKGEKKKPGEGDKKSDDKGDDGKKKPGKDKGKESPETDTDEQDHTDDNVYGHWVNGTFLDDDGKEIALD